MSLAGLHRMLYKLLVGMLLLVPVCVPASVSAASSSPIPLLWKVEGANGALYLLGSFHMLRPSDYPLSSDVENAFEDSQRVVFELSPEEANAATLNVQMLQVAQRRDGSGLQADLDQRTWHKLKAYMRQQGLPIEVMEGFKTWFVGLSVTLTQLQKQGMDPQLGLDQYLMGKAHKAGKSTAGLESAAEQLRMLDEMTRDEQGQMLAEALDDAEDGGKALLQLHAAWRRGDAHMLGQQMAAEMKRDYPALYRHINVERNQRWLPLLERRLQQGGNTLVVVGALHLLGSDGVVEQLRERGWRVQRVCSLCTERDLP